MSKQYDPHDAVLEIKIRVSGSGLDRDRHMDVIVDRLREGDEMDDVMDAVMEAVEVAVPIGVDIELDTPWASWRNAAPRGAAQATRKSRFGS